MSDFAIRMSLSDKGIKKTSYRNKAGFFVCRFGGVNFKKVVK